MRVSARFIRSEKPGEAWPVPIDNILDWPDRHVSMSMEPSSTPQVFDVLVHSRSPEHQRVWFEVFYDAGGAKNKISNSVVLGPS
jgi:hypothetical protein